MRNFLKPFSFLPAILMMYIIFHFSAEKGVDSSALSYKVSNKIVMEAGEFLDISLTDDQIQHYTGLIHGKVRKAAHFTEYAVLAVYVAFPLYVYGLRGLLLMIVAGSFCLAFAVSDEFHQTFVAGRTPSKKDVLIDGIGILCGIIFVRIVGFTGRMTIFRKKKMKT